MFGQIQTFYKEIRNEGSEEEYTITIPVIKKFYQSDPIVAYDEKHGFYPNTLKELPPGRYRFPFRFSPPSNLPPSVHFTELCQLFYGISATASFNTGIDIQTPIHRVPLCITLNNYEPDGVIFSLSGENTLIELMLLKTNVNVGETVHCKLTRTTGTRKTNFNFQVELKTKHIYRGEKTKIHKIFFKRNVKSDEPQSIVEFDITIPIDTPVTTNYQEFVVNSKIIVRFGSNGIKMKREINVHSSITDPLIMRERSKSVGYEISFISN